MLNSKLKHGLIFFSFSVLWTTPFVQAAPIDLSLIDDPLSLNKAVNVRSISSFPADLKDSYIDKIREVETFGFVNVSDKDVNSISVSSLKSKLLVLDDTEKNAISWRVNASNTSLNSYNELGVLIASESAVSRVFVDDSGTVIRLDETKYSLYGGGVLVPSELVNTQVKGNPAILLTEKAPSGKTIIYLAWDSGDTYYVASTNADASQAEILLSSLANELP